MSSRLRPPKPRVITAMQPFLLWPAAAIPLPPTSARPVDPDVGPTHGDVIVSGGSGGEVLRGEDAVAHKPVSANCPPPAEAWSGQQLSRYSD